MECPCRYCEKKGCGAYHDICEKYKEYREFRESISRQKELKVKTYYKKEIKRWQKSKKRNKTN
jgi:hypothetical protein